MHNFTLPRILLLAFAVTFLPGINFMSVKTNIRAAETAVDETNPLLAGWTGPYGGIPPFDKVQISQFKPALEAAMNENLAEIDQIANETSAPTFENTIAALERTGSTLERVSTFYGIWAGTMSTPELRAVEREMGPKFAALTD